MTGFYPGGSQGPADLFQNQSDLAVPPITVTGNQPFGLSALPNNFQTIPVHSDVGNLNQTVFQGYDPTVCPILGEIRLYLLS